MAQQQHHQQWIISPTVNSVNKSFETTSSSSSFVMDPATPHVHAMMPPPPSFHNLAAKGAPPQAHPYQLNSPPLPPSHQVITPNYPPPPPPAFLPTQQTQPQPPQQHYLPPHNHHHLSPQHMIQHNVYAPEMASGISPLPPPYPYPPQQTTVYPFPSPPPSSGYHPVQAPAATTLHPAQPALVVQLSSPPSLPQHQPHAFLPSPQFQLQAGAMLQHQVGQPAVYAGPELVFAHPATSDNGPRQLMITFLDPDVSNAELHAAFAAIGPVDAARVIYDKGTGKSKCFGFVYYRYSRDAATATQCMSGHPIRGKRIKVIFASPQRPLPPSEL